MDLLINVALKTNQLRLIKHFTAKIASQKNKHKNNNKMRGNATMLHSIKCLFKEIL